MKLSSRYNYCGSTTVAISILLITGSRRRRFWSYSGFQWIYIDKFPCVADGNAKSVNVLFENGEKKPGTVLWNDSLLDLAIVKVDATNFTCGSLRRFR